MGRKKKKQSKSSKENGDREVLKRSNALIQAKSSNTLMQRKLFAYAMTQMRVVQGEYGGTKLVATVNIGQLNRELGKDNHVMYSRGKKISKEVLQHMLVLEDDEKNNRFVAINLLDKVEYNNGNLTLVFNDEIRAHTVDVDRKYTIMYLDTLLSFKHNNTFRIYELLSVYKYLLKGTSEKKPFEKEYNLSELKFEIGLVDMTDEMKDALNKGKDWDYLLENMMDNPPYKSYSNFRTRVLEVAKKEINGSRFAEIAFDYEPIRQGIGGKTTGIRFFIWLKKGASNSDVLLLPDNDAINELMLYSNGALTNSQASTLLRLAENNLSLVKGYFDEAQKNGHIQDLMGWMVKAISERWKFNGDIPKISYLGDTVDNGSVSGGTATDKGRKKKSSNARSTSFSNYTERNNDYDELQRQLLQRSMVKDEKYEENEQLELNLSDEPWPEQEMTASDMARAQREAIDVEFRDADQEEELPFGTVRTDSVVREKRSSHKKTSHKPKNQTADTKKDDDTKDDSLKAMLSELAQGDLTEDEKQLLMKIIARRKK